MVRGLYVRGVGVCTDEFPDLQALRTRNPRPPRDRLKAPILDRQCARRASNFAKSMALAFAESIPAEIEPGTISTVFGSCLGETTVMLRLLEQMIRGEDDFSPMLFAVSVHNAASGMVSISTKNRAFTTSIAADHDTPAMAILEAFGACESFECPAVIVCGDEAAPEGLVGSHEAFSGLAAAICVDLTPGPSPLAHIELPTLSRTGRRAPDIPEALGRNPQVGLLNLVDAVLERRAGPVLLDHGKGRGFAAEVRPC